MAVFGFSRRAALAAVAAIAFAGCGAADGDTSQTAALEPSLGEMSLGPDDAPVTLIEYASLTCGHCKDFHETVLPRIKQDYIEPGRIRFVFREFPTQPAELALAGFAVARCAGEDKYFDVIGDFFANQGDIFEEARAGRALEALQALGARHGVGGAAFETCRNDLEVRRAIADIVVAGEAAGVNATPTLILNGERLTTAASRTPDGLASLIEAALVAAETSEDAEPVETETEN